MSRYGLSYEQFRAINPRLVYCSVTRFGAGNGAHLPGYDLLVQAVGGLMSITGPCPGEPVKAGVALVDVLALDSTVTVGDPGDTVTLIANPIRLSVTPPRYRRRPTRLGEHTDQVRAWLRQQPPTGGSTGQAPTEPENTRADHNSGADSTGRVRTPPALTAPLPGSRS